MQKRHIFSILLFCGLMCGLRAPVAGQVFHDESFKSRAMQGLEATYDFRFDEAERLFRALKRDYMRHPGPHFLLAVNRWWQSYISTGTHYHAYIAAQLDTVLLLNQSLAGNRDYAVEYTFFQYMAYAFQARLYILRQEWFSAANAGRKALPYLQPGLAYADQSPEFYYSAGIYHYYAETYPAKHAYIRPFMMFFPDANATKGLAEMELAARTPNFTQVEAMYYLGDIYLEEEQDYTRALAIHQQLYQRYPGNTWFRRNYGRALVYAGKPAEAIAVLSGMVQRYEALAGHRTKVVTSRHSTYTTFVMQQVYHYLGRAYLSQHNLAAAEQAFKQSLQCAALGTRPDDTYRAQSWYYLGRVYDRLGQRTAARDAYAHALVVENNEDIASDARYCLQKPCSY
ncbi:MAG: hypothetical protein OHK0039_23030 [Bacteroidia bacterium]